MSWAEWAGWGEWAVPGVKMLDAGEAEHSGQWSPPTRARHWGGAGPGQCGAAERSTLATQTTGSHQSAAGRVTCDHHHPASSILQLGLELRL